MIGKGWDIPNVTLVGVILADVGLHLPDFRASERNFQLLTQVAGRAGRGEHAGEVIIQTYNPENLSLKWAEKQDYESFYKEEITHRKALNYPPFSSMVKFTTKNKEQKICSERAAQLEKKIKTVGLETEVACAPAMIAKKNHHYYWNVFLWSLNPQPILDQLEKGGMLKEWQIDVDPISTF
jgi:primosomal protein N' (replication factor Y)